MHPTFSRRFALGKSEWFLCYARKRKNYSQGGRMRDSRNGLVRPCSGLAIALALFCASLRDPGNRRPVAYGTYICVYARSSFQVRRCRRSLHREALGMVLSHRSLDGGFCVSSRRRNHDVPACGLRAAGATTSSA